MEGKRVLITGAGSGLGREMAKAFANAGATVVGIGRTIEKLEETAVEVGEKFNAFACDTSDAASVANTMDEIVSKVGQIDIVFNNAAVYPKINFLDETPEDFSKAVSINLVGVANMCKAVLPAMIKQNSGRIFNLGSWADIAPISDSAVYSCTKGAIHSLTKAIAVDLAAKNVSVEVHEWIPGHLNTQMSDYTGMDPSIAAGWAVEIASRPASSNNCIFEQNWEWQPPKSLKQKIKSKIFFWKK